MPNWNNNAVTIGAPVDQVKEWLIPLENGDYEFDLHKLFPEVTETNFPTDQLTGSKWNPVIDSCEIIGELARASDQTNLGYESARTPNNGTLERLHELTGWTIENEFEEPGCDFEGTFVCEDGTCVLTERPYHPPCDVCDTKHAPDEYLPEADDRVCRQCRAASPRYADPRMGKIDKIACEADRLRGEVCRQALAHDDPVAYFDNLERFSKGEDIIAIFVAGNAQVPFDRYYASITQSLEEMWQAGNFPDFVPDSDLRGWLAEAAYLYEAGKIARDL